MVMQITRTAKIKLKISTDELCTTFKAVTQAFNYVCKVGHETKDFNSISLHHKTYYDVRKLFNLPADLAVQTRMKSAESLKPAIKKKRKCPKSKLCSVRLSSQNYNIWFDRQEVSLLTIDGRIKTSFYFPEWFKQYISWRRKSAELIIRKDKVYLCVVFQKDIEDFQQVNNPTILGIDRGINKVAVCSDNTFFNGNILKVSHRYQRLRQQLQKCGTPSAKRHLKKISLKENCFRKDVNHCISKRIVESLPENSIIVLEDLKKIRQRVRLNKKGRRKLHNWSFYQLEQFLTYKAEAEKIKIDFVDARYTSQKCSKCGHISRSNRKSQAVFKCVQCGFSLNSDLNASRNIEANYRDAKGYPEGLSVNQPIVAHDDAKGSSEQLRRSAVTSHLL
jgi:IS605 OrfB family transposase